MVALPRGAYNGPVNNPIHRRDLFTGKAVAERMREVGDQLADSMGGHTNRPTPAGGPTLRLTTTAMACDFSVILHGGAHEHVWSASSALDLVHQLEAQLSVYQADSEISRLNQTAAERRVVTEPGLFELLRVAKQISADTQNAFDLTTDPLIHLWRDCRTANRLPTESEINQRLAHVSMDLIEMDDEARSVTFLKPGVSINVNAIGKGYALDRVAESILKDGPNTYLLHGGHSSLLARGLHQGHGWPIGIGNPIFTDRRLGTLLLQDQAMATSGSNIQYFRVHGERYGHILDPRTGWPVEHSLSVTAIAPTAAMADALSTAFYVLGPDRTQKYCQRHPEVGVISIPLPRGDRRVTPQVIGIDPQRLFWDTEQVVVNESPA